MKQRHPAPLSACLNVNNRHRDFVRYAVGRRLALLGDGCVQD